ncbi:MAG: inositol-3-phosphate synthase [Pyrinomonadaceae bacterium]
MSQHKLGVMIVGLGGAVATTAVAGIELLKQKTIGFEGLPLAAFPEELVSNLTGYENLLFGGWDLTADDLSTAAATHNVLTLEQYRLAAPALAQITPLPAIGNVEFCRNIAGENILLVDNHRASIAAVRQNILEFQVVSKCEQVVVINLASTEKFIDKSAAVFCSLQNFEQALDNNSPEIAPAMIYAYAAIAEGAGYGNFTPSVAADIPALVEFAKQNQVPLAGKDGKTGQTMIKTVLAPAFKTRALKVEGWYSTNILGNRDGLALADAESLKSKITTKGSVLDDILGYTVEDHIVDIRYYRPRGDNKEAWDNIDVTGFLGQPMQIKINFLCRDSILAAPLVIEIARLLDLAKRRGYSGVQEQLSVFFKLPQVADEATEKPVHALHLQEKMLLDWLCATEEI